MNPVENQKLYLLWWAIKQRCCNPKNKDYSLYGVKGVKLCNEWMIYNNFKEWYLSNYYTVENERMAVDKDILGNGKLYSTETCLIVPYRINGLFVHKINENRGIQEKYGKYQVKVRNGTKNEYIGTYISLEEARENYKKRKTEIIIGVAEEYKDKIPKKVYDALLTFKL